MTLSSFNLFVLVISLMVLLAQLFVREKHTSHILFAVFSGSIAMTLAKMINGDSIGAYQYLIGLGTVATCNCYWLLSRSLFRDKDAIAGRHLALALVISLLLFVRQGYLFASSTDLISAGADSLTNHILSEFTILLSSCTLVLSFWEGCRGYKNSDKQGKAQRILFLATFATGVVVSKLSDGVMVAEAREWIISSLILLVLINTQILMFWRYRKPTELTERELTDSHIVLAGTMSLLQQDYTEKLEDTEKLEGTEKPEDSQAQNKAVTQAEQTIADEVKALLVEQQLFLQANLKVGDIAKALNLPEYRVSKALRNHLNARNFNQYVNELRIKYAQEILIDSNKKQWPVLVVGLESGFASVGPFTRAFKAQTGLTPNQYRQNHFEDLALESIGAQVNCSS